MRLLCSFFLWLALPTFGAEDCRAIRELTGDNDVIHYPERTINSAGVSNGTLAPFMEGSGSIDRQSFLNKAREAFGTPVTIPAGPGTNETANALADHLIGKLVALPHPNRKRTTEQQFFRLPFITGGLLNEPVRKLFSKQVTTFHALYGRVTGIDVDLRGTTPRLTLRVRNDNKNEPETVTTDGKDLHTLVDITTIPRYEPTPEESQILSANNLPYTHYKKEMGQLVYDVCKARGWCFQGFGIPWWAKLSSTQGKKYLEGSMRITTSGTIPLMAQGQAAPPTMEITVQSRKILMATPVEFVNPSLAVRQMIAYPSLIRRTPEVLSKLYNGAWGWTYATIEVGPDGIPGYSRESLQRGYGRVTLMPPGD